MAIKMKCESRKEEYQKGNRKNEVNAFFAEISDHTADTISFIVFPVAVVEYYANGIYKTEAADGEEKAFPFQRFVIYKYGKN